jgi:hypothetical protein
VPPPHLLKKFSNQARESSQKRGAPNYLKAFATLCIEWAMNSKPTPNPSQIRSSDITPPPELVQQWWEQADQYQDDPKTYFDYVATEAAQWGADQELEACCEWMVNVPDFYTGSEIDLRAARRPKPPSLKEQALQALSEAVKMADDVPPEGICSGQADIIRRALEALPE